MAMNNNNHNNQNLKMEYYRFCNKQNGCKITTNKSGTIATDELTVAATVAAVVVGYQQCGSKAFSHTKDGVGTNESSLILHETNDYKYDIPKGIPRIIRVISQNSVATAAAIVAAPTVGCKRKREN